MSSTCAESLSNYPDLTNICQLDGAFDLPLSASDTTGQASSNGKVTNTGQATTNVGTIIRAPYSLNRKKQLSKLGNDTNIKDFEIIVSPTEQNINILCSTGFYSMVVMPAFSPINVGHYMSTADTDIRCYDLTGKIDGTQASVNTVIFFKLTSSNKSRTHNVTVTLHHTVRKVQVQGSSIINNKSRANVWFLENIILAIFTNISSDKSINISKFNNAVRGMVASHIDKLNSQLKCKTCDIPLSGRSQYEQCNICKLYFHRKCMSSFSHSCSHDKQYNRTLPNVLSMPQFAFPSANQTTTLHNTNSALLPVLDSGTPNASAALRVTRSASPAAPIADTRVTGDTSPAAPNEVPRVVGSASPAAPIAATRVTGGTSLAEPNAVPRVAGSVPPAVPNNTSTVAAPTIRAAPTATYSALLPVLASAAPNAPSSTESASPTASTAASPTVSAAPTATTPTTTRNPVSGSLPLDPSASTFTPMSVPSTKEKPNKSKSKAKPTLATTKDTIDLEFARVEINTIRTKLREQETEIKDIKFQNSILLERVSIFEKTKKQAIYERYFPQASDATAGTNSSHEQPPPLPSGPTSHCCHLQHCCTGAQLQKSSPANCPAADKIDTLLKNIDDLKMNVANIKLIKNMSTNLPVSSMGSSSPRPPGTHSDTSTAGPSPDRVATTDDLSNSNHDDSSILTIDEEMPEDELLNSNLTIQF